MSLAVADLQKQREEVRARLLANEAVRGGSLSAPMRFISGAATDMAVPSITGCRPKVRSSHLWSNKSFNCRLYRQAGRASRAISAIRQTTGQTQEEIAITCGIGLRYSFQAQSEDQTGRADQRQNRQRRDENQPNCEEASRCERQEKGSQRIGK